jgi:hypothetical protein
MRLLKRRSAASLSPGTVALASSFSAISPHAIFAHWREKESRRLERQQAKCHEHLREESTKRSGNSHGFELNRTVWYSLKGHKTAQNDYLAAHGDAQSAHVPAAVKRPE